MALWTYPDQNHLSGIVKGETCFREVKPRARRKEGDRRYDDEHGAEPRSTSGRHTRARIGEFGSGGMKTILVGFDGTRPAERALDHAAELARAFGSRVVVVTVAPPQPIESIAASGAFSLMPYYSYRVEELAEPVQRDEALWQQHRDRVQALFAGAGIQWTSSASAASRRRRSSRWPRLSRPT